MERRTLEWKRTKGSAEAGVHIQTLMRTDYRVSYGKIVFGTLHLEWLNEISLFAPHQHALGHILADAVGQALCTMRGLSTVTQDRSDKRA